MRIGIFGGTFDPPHIGHQILAAEALEQLELDKVFWLPTPFPPHKKLEKITPLIHRLRMVELVVDGDPEFVLSKVDIERKPPHYAVDTMALLHNQAPDDDYFYLMGLDSLNDLLTWHRPTDFVDLCKGIGVMYRQGEVLETAKLEKEITGIGAKVYYLKTPIIEISASDIRFRAESGKQFRYFVPEKIYRYIVENQLYLS
jgi:nicotinate-nucleotide adenylyltransferase